MRRVFLATVIALLAVAPAAQADEIGGGGFEVPQASEWLWGIEGLVRTPIDLSGEIGVAFIDHEIEGRNTYIDDFGAPVTQTIRNTLDVTPEALEGGFRISGGIGYWSCCVLIEPAIGFRAFRAYGEDSRDYTSRLFDLDEPLNTRAEVELNEGWDLTFGPKMTWIIPEDTAFVGPYLGGLPLVFFPYIGVSHFEWDVRLDFNSPFFLGSRSFRKSFEDEIFVVGFDIDFPLPGQIGPFTHAFTFGFRWNDRGSDHDLGPYNYTGGGSLSPGSSGCGSGFPGFPGDSCYRFEDQDGWRIGLYYRVTWNDLDGFIKEHLFGPVN